MPFTPYHFGPSGFVGLVFKKWIDLPVFVLANVVVDVEVLIIEIFHLGWPVHRYAHTLLLGAVVGALWGVAAYPLRPVFNKVMQLFRIPYQSSLKMMIVSGVLGVWLHVLIDAVDHFDLRLFWPNTTISLYQLLHPYIRQGYVKIICLIFFVPAIILYILTVIKSRKNLKQTRTSIEK